MSPQCIGSLLAVLVLWTPGPGHVANAQPTSSSSPVVAYEGGHVWNGSGFSKKTLFVQDGALVSNPTTVDSTVRLEGGYVIPPFGDAHTHNLGAGGISQQLAADLYVPQGIFYALDLTNPYSEIEGVQDAFRGPESIDVAYANGGLTSTGSHPTAAMERTYTDTEKVTLENLTLRGDAYWFMDTVADVNAKWRDYLAQTPDVVKVYLTYVKRGLEQDECWGLCPEVLKAVVDSAHAAEKRVFAHVSTANDVRTALGAGVDALAHLPSGNDGIKVNDERFWLKAATIQRAGRDSLVLTPTASLLVEDADPDTLQAEIDGQRTQLRQLHEAGVRIALGADDWRKTSRHEAFYLHEHAIFSPRTLLTLWTVTTPQAIFPNRKIGRLVPGYEASFLVLDGNPVEDFDAVRRIRLGVKQGHLLHGRTSDL